MTTSDQSPADDKRNPSAKDKDARAKVESQQSHPNPVHLEQVLSMSVPPTPTQSAFGQSSTPAIRPKRDSQPLPSYQMPTEASKRRASKSLTGPDEEPQPQETNPHQDFRNSGTKIFCWRNGELPESIYTSDQRSQSPHFMSSTAASRAKQLPHKNTVCHLEVRHHSRLKRRDVDAA